MSTSVPNLSLQLPKGCPPPPPGQTDLEAWVAGWQSGWIKNASLPLTCFGFPQFVQMEPPCDKPNVYLFPRKMIACPLTINGPDGSVPDGKSAWWTKYFCTAKLAYKKRAYVQGHLLNHNVHGPGTWRNLVPITDQLNRFMEKWAESVVKKLVTQGKILYYEVTVHWNCGAKSGSGEDWMGNAARHPIEMHRAFDTELALGECLAPTSVEWNCREIQWKNGGWKFAERVEFKGYEDFENHHYPNSFNQIKGKGISWEELSKPPATDDSGDMDTSGE